MRTLVIGGTGTVGSQVVTNLVAQRAEVRVMTSTPEKISKLPAGVEGVVGNLRDRDSLTKVFEGVERAFVITPLSETEREEGLNAVDAGKKAGLKRLVYMSVNRLEDIPAAPHFAEKIPVENAIKASGIPYTIIRPSNFFQNDLWFQQPIIEYGVYAQPIGNTGVQRVDVRDIADAVTTALTKDGYTNRTYNLVGPEVLTGNGTAETYARLLGKNVLYAGDDLEQWGAQAVKMMPKWMVDDLKIMFKHFQTKGLIGGPEHLKETETILDRKPRSFEDFAKEVTTGWKQSVGSKVKTA